MYTELAPPATIHPAQRGDVEQQQGYLGGLGDEQVDLELFRRAIGQQDELAWEQVYQRWRGLLLHWLFRHPFARLALERWSSEDYVTLALSKFWQAVTHPNGHAPHFSSRPDILAYLRCCLNSAILDAVREVRAHQHDVRLEHLVERVGSGSPDVGGEAFWKCIEQVLPERRELLQKRARKPRVFRLGRNGLRLFLP